MTDKANSSQPPFLAFASDNQDIEAIKQFAATHDWADSCVMQGDIRTAAGFLKNHTSPQLLLVEISSAAGAQAELDALAEVCDPDTKVVITGTVNEYSFYCWLMDIGISSYLLRPLTQEALETAYEKSTEKPAAPVSQEKQPGKLIAVMGTRGGVGATTVAINLAGILAEQGRKRVALIDIDPQEGSIALTLDMEPSRGFRDALEKPDRIDSLFIERVMNKVGKYLSVLSSEESMQDMLNVHDHASDALLKEMREKFDYIVLDIPRFLNAFSKKCLAKADHVVLVTEMTLLNLRDTLRMGDLMRESLKMKPPLIVANRVGAAPKFEMRQADYEKGINAKISASVPFAPDVFMHISNDIPAVKLKASESVRPLYQLAQLLVPDAKIDSAMVKKDQKSTSLFSFMGGKKEAPKPKKEDT